VEYQEAVAVFFAPSPPDTVQPSIVRDGGPARRLRDAIEPIAMHAVWCARTNERLAEAFGLEFLGAYAWGRASALGDAAPAVAVAAFAVFEPSFLTGVLTDARSKASWSDLVTARDAATAESLRELLDGEAVADVTAVLRPGIDAADPAGRPLFAGLAAQEWPSDEYGQLWRACDILREHRGDSHVAACVAAGLDAAEMNILTEVWLGMPLYAYSASRAWSPDALGAATDRLRSRGLLADDALTPAGLALRDGIEAATDAAQSRVVAAIGADLDGAVERLAGWSARLIDGGAFPPSVHKRAAG
jgi:Helix-turn-helix family